MCGRYTLTTPPRQLIERFAAEFLEDIFRPRFNVAPTQPMPVITNADPAHFTFMRWGLIPSWSKEPPAGGGWINARSESAAQKPSFRAAFKRRRCLVPADGFYEWQKTDHGKVPTRIALRGSPLFAFAGLYETWTEPGGAVVPTFTILTTAANRKLSPVHDRMPIILRREVESAWLDNDAEPADWQELLQPYDDEEIIYHPVSRRVNSPRNDDPDLLVEVVPESDADTKTSSSTASKSKPSRPAAKKKRARSDNTDSDNTSADTPARKPSKRMKQKPDDTGMLF